MIGHDKVTAAQPRPINLVSNDDERSFVVIQTRNLGYTHTEGLWTRREVLLPVRPDPFVVVSLLSTTPVEVRTQSTLPKMRLPDIPLPRR